jgi:eukaryotic-like serine/threonine-protein kinase
LLLPRCEHREGNLAGKLDGKPLPAWEAAKLVEALAQTMQLSHSRDVVHRDLEPANILVWSLFPS